MNLVVLDESEVSSDGSVTLTGARAAHLLSVLHVARGHTVCVGVLDGPRGTATVMATAAGTVDLRCVFESSTPPRPPVDLLLAVPRPKVLRRLWAQLAAIGVGRIILTNAARVERNYFDTHVLSADCYRPLLIEGLQQARDTRLPLVSVHRQFRKLVEDDLDTLAADARRLVAHPGAARSIAGAIGDRATGRVLLAVGPEGGWNQFELDLLRSRDFETVALGARALRVDTACVALLALAHAALDRGGEG